MAAAQKSARVELPRRRLGWQVEVEEKTQDHIDPGPAQLEEAGSREEAGCGGNQRATIVR